MASTPSDAKTRSRTARRPPPTEGPAVVSGVPQPAPSGQTVSQSIETSCALVEKALGGSQAFKKIEPRLYVVKQGSSYVMISILASGMNRDRALVRVVAQVVSGVRPEASLFRQLLTLNGTLRFGAFAYVPDGELVLFAHSLLGGATLDQNELLAAVHDVALVADAYDDRIVARYGGRRMQDVIEDSALNHVLNPEEEELSLPGPDGELPEEAPAPAKKKPAPAPAKKPAPAPAKKKPAPTQKAAPAPTKKKPAAKRPRSKQP